MHRATRTRELPSRRSELSLATPTRVNSGFGSGTGRKSSARRTNDSFSRSTRPAPCVRRSRRRSSSRRDARSARACSTLRAISESAVDALLASNAALRGRELVRLLGLLRRLPKTPTPHLREAKLRGRTHSRKRDRAAIGFHYDQPIEFYRSFLDRQMVYSCAYFDDGIESLDDAQSAKLDYTLRKLRLRPGERLLDVGCGWGAMVIRAAQLGSYALGITLSRPQCEEARRRIATAGISAFATVELCDYRELRGETFDKIVSVGMFEHVGRSRFAEYFAAAYAALRPGGLFLNHAIAEEQRQRRDGTSERLHRAFHLSRRRARQPLRRAGRGGTCRVRSAGRGELARALRAHTSRVGREPRAQSRLAIAAAGEASYRLWRLYMAGSAQGFATGGWASINRCSRGRMPTAAWSFRRRGGICTPSSS